MSNYIEIPEADESSSISGDPVFQYSTTIVSGSTGAAVILPDGAGKVTVWNVALILTAGQSGKVQYSISPKPVLEAGTANWFDWSLGTITASGKTALENVTGVRAISVSGDLIFEVRIS